MSKGMRTGVVMAGAAALSVTGFVTRAQDVVDAHFQSHALRYAGMIERAYGRLYGHIRSNESGPVSWSGAAVPPASTGWDAVWTEAGLRARYCADHLVVYMGLSEVKGVGGEHRAIQQARRSFLPERERGVKLPLLSWLEASKVLDGDGSALDLDECITANYSEPLPSRRAALAGKVEDPATVVRKKESYETRVEPCPAGSHGQQRERRLVTQQIDANDNDVEPPVYGAWESAPGSWCRPDYTYYELFTRPCRSGEVEPFDREMEGTQTWRVLVSVGADPASSEGEPTKTRGTAERVANTCGDTPPGPAPVPSISHEYVTETQILGCEPGMSGQIDSARQHITTTTTYPWGEDPLVTVSYTNWSETSNSCRRVGSGGDHDGSESTEGQEVENEPTEMSHPSFDDGATSDDWGAEPPSTGSSENSGNGGGSSGGNQQSQAAERH